MSLLRKFFKFREEANPEAVKPFLDHLEDLRWTLLKCAATLIAGMGLSFTFRAELVRVMQRPLAAIDPELVAKLQVLGVTDSITISFKLAFYAGIVLTFPFLTFFVAQFVVPALTRAEKRYLVPALAISFGLFLVGVLFAYYYVLPGTLHFFFQDARSMQWTPMWTVRDYFSFVAHLTLALGLAFELPVAVLLLVKLKFLTFDLMRKTRVFAVVIILCLAAVIAPTPDPFTFLALGGPMWALYEICIWLAWFIERRERQALAKVGAGDSPADPDGGTGRLPPAG